MEFRRAIFLFSLAFLASAFLVHAFPSGVAAETALPVRNIDSGKDFSTIQEAINDPETLDGHTIRVEMGVYREPLLVNKSVRLAGEDKFNTTIDGGEADAAIYVVADNVEIAGFTILNSSIRGVGVHVDNSRGVNISRSVIIGHNRGVYLNSSDNGFISSSNLTGNSQGVLMEFSENNVLWGNTLSNIGEGIQLLSSDNNLLSGNNISGSTHGLYIDSSSGNVLSGNLFTNNSFGVWLNRSSLNILLGNEAREGDNGFKTVSSVDNHFVLNTVANNYIGVAMESSGNNTFFHNSFLNNTRQVRLQPPLRNLWDWGYPSGGNHWSDYNGTDRLSGLRQEVNGSDGIGDTPYAVDANNTDHAPLMGQAYDFSFVWEGGAYHIPIICNSSVSDLDFDGSLRMISFNVAGPGNTTGFCRVPLPYTLINGPYVILVDDQESGTAVPPVSNGTHAFLYFTYNLSIREVKILSRPYYTLSEELKSLSQDYENLTSRHNALIANYTALEAEHAALEADHASLKDDYDALNATLQELRGNHTELRLDLEATTKELAEVRDTMYIFAVTTVAGLALLLPFGVRYYLVSKRQKKIIEAYDPLRIASALFKTDVERRGAKIEKFEEKYGVKIRPRESLEDAIESMKRKKVKD